MNGLVLLLRADGRSRNGKRLVVGRDSYLCVDAKVVVEKAGEEDGQPGNREEEDMQTEPARPVKISSDPGLFSQVVSRSWPAPRPGIARAERASDAPSLLLLYSAGSTS